MPEENYALEEVYKSIGESEKLRKVADIIKEGYFQDNESFVRWWYDSNKGLNDKSPDELCKEGKQNKLESILMDALLGAHGG